MATVLIVEDETLIAEEIARQLTRLGHKPLGPVATGEEALSLLSRQAVELVLIDLNLAGDSDGIATALRVRRQFAVPVVFVTARADSATLSRAKLAHPCGFLVKPFTEESLRAQLELALCLAYQAEQAGVGEEQARPLPQAAGEKGPCPRVRDYLFVRKGAGHVKVLLRDILYFEALQNYVRLHTVLEKIVFDCTLKKLEQKLPEQFLRTHRSYIVNLDHVQAYEEGGVQLAQAFVPVSRSCKEALKLRIPLVG